MVSEVGWWYLAFGSVGCSGLVLSIWHGWDLGALMTMFMCMQSYATRAMDVTTRNDFSRWISQAWMYGLEKMGEGYSRMELLGNLRASTNYKYSFAIDHVFCCHIDM